MTTLQPIVKWAQRKSQLFLELGLRDVKDQKLQLTEFHIKFSCVSNKQNFAFQLQFFEAVDQESSKWQKTGFQIRLVLEKKEKNKAYWPRLTKENKKIAYVQCDWQKWIDEDEQEEEGNKGLGSFDPAAMNNFKEQDSDDEKIEDEKEEKVIEK